MSRVVEKFVKDETILPKIVLLIVSVVLLIVGLYAVGPWYVGSPTTAMGAVLETDIVRAIPATIYIISGVIGIWGVIFKKSLWRYRAAFLCTVSYAFLTILRLLTFGFVPIIWLFVLALCLISAIIYLWESGREVE